MIVVEDLALTLGAFALRGLSLAVPSGRYGVLMGRTGSGKTSVLEAIAGLRPIQAGRILLAGRDATHLTPGARGLGYVPQDAALFGTMTVRDHLGFALKIRSEKREVVEERVAELADWLGLAALLDRRPTGLSGGEAQRVALGRALSFRPAILLLDEPLSALDEETREQMYEILQRLRERREVTVLHVTHGRQEAERLGEVLLRLEGGRVSNS